MVALASAWLMGVLNAWYAVWNLVNMPQVLLDASQRLPAVEAQHLMFSENWHILGPWQIGTREVPWGADPTEQYGGFRALKYDEHVTFRSSLAVNGSIAWIDGKADISSVNPDRASAELTVQYNDVDFRVLQDVYGWSALQWQAWARGKLFIEGKHGQTQTFVLYTDNILEFWIDDQQYFGGDFYAYRRAPLTLHLYPGVHRIDVRLVRDVRGMGGVGSPEITVRLELQRSVEALTSIGSILVSDCLADDSTSHLASPYASITVRNDATEPIQIEALTPESNLWSVKLLQELPVRLVPGQSRPILFQVAGLEPCPQDMQLAFQYRRMETPDQSVEYLPIATKLRLRNIHDPHKVTFLHPGGIVSYAVLRPPSSKAATKCASDAKLPVLLVLHGAGLEADDTLVRHSLDEVPDLCAWTLFPTGVTPWSGDDWHVWGLADVEAAISAIPQWIDHVRWPGPGVDIDSWLVAGHSNGGQGTWYTMTHRPDKVIAAAPISGYSSIQNYVSYNFWQPADPARTAVLQAGLNSYRHELLLENVKGIPILQQHGSADDNVPAYHSRLLSQRLRQSGATSNYVEVPGRPHWWDGVMTTEPLREFFQHHLGTAPTGSKVVPLPLREWSLVVANPADSGPKSGLEILQVAVAGRLAKLEVTYDPLTLACLVHTSNVRMFRTGFRFGECSFVVVDGQHIERSDTASEAKQFVRSSDGWDVVTRDVSDSLPAGDGQRFLKQTVGMDNILRTAGRFMIVPHAKSNVHVSHVALQISRNQCQYFAADTEITTDYEKAVASSGNIISIAVGVDLPNATSDTHAVQIQGDFLWIKDGTSLHGFDTRYGQVAIYLRPLPNGRLELVVWAGRQEDLAIAARLVPMMTGAGQPDFVVADRRMLWKGVEGVLAMGFFDEKWGVSRTAFFS